MGRIRRALKALTVSHPRGRADFSLLYPNSRFDYRQTVGDGSNSSVVAAPLNWICRTFPESPMMVERHLEADDWEAQPDHPVVELLERPNPFFTGEQLWVATLTSRVLDGNAYWFKVHDGSLRVTELWYMPHWLMEPKFPKDGSEFISHYEYRPGGGPPIRLETESIIHFRDGVDPDNIRKGRSPLATVLREVFADDEASNFAGSLLRNMGVPGLIISPRSADVTVDDPDELEATKDKIESKTTGDERGKPIVLGSATDVKQFGFTPEQLDLRALRRVPEERISGAIGVPAIVSSFGAGLDRSTFSNFKEAREAAYESCIIPMQRQLAADVKHQLLDADYPLPGRQRVIFDLTGVRVLQEDENAIVDRKLKELGSGAITLAEYRRDTGREADETHEVYLRPFNITEVPAGELGQPAPSSSGEEPGSPPDDEEDDGEEFNFDKAVAKLLDGSKAKASSQAQYILRLNAEAAGFERRFEKQLLAIFQEVGDAIADQYMLSTLLSGKTKADDPDEAVEEQARKLMRDARLGELEDRKLRPAFRTHYEGVLQGTKESVEAVFNLGVDFPDHEARQILNAGGTRAGLVELSDNTRSALVRAIGSGRAEGLGPLEIAKRIRSEVPAGRFVNAGAKYRAQLIARTETKYAQNISSMATYRHAPGVAGLLAFDAQGAESDADCIARDGTVFTFAEAETELASEHPNGTLSFAPVLSEGVPTS